MLINSSYQDVDIPSSKNSARPHQMRIFTFSPNVPGYPKAKFPGVVVFR